MPFRQKSFPEAMVKLDFFFIYIYFCAHIMLRLSNLVVSSVIETRSDVNI
jgi:hypothetical protein